MIAYPRRSATKVRNGRTQRKNRSSCTPNYLTHEMPSLVIDRKNPMPGYRYLATKDDIRRFIALLPNWEELSEGLDAIVLDHGSEDRMGWHRPGVVAVCAWDRAIELEGCSLSFISEHHEILEKLGVPFRWGHNATIAFTEATARAFSLIHVLVHELGHHHDRMTTRSRKQACRGEPYAEAYARCHEDEILTRYQSIFDL
jgi:hypothetical protein